MNNSKKVVLIINDLKGNGAERVVITLAENFLRKGISPAIICFKKDVQLPLKKEIPLIVFPEKLFRWIPRRIRGIVIAPFLDLFVKKNFGKPNLILSNLTPSDRILAYSKLENVHLIIHGPKKIYVPKSSKNIKEAIKETIRIYKKKPCICVSEGVKKDLELLLNHKHPNIKMIHNGIDVEYILKSSNDIPKDLIQNAIIHVGKFSNVKRQDKLIKAYSNISCKYPLVFIGKGPKINEAKTLVNELGLENRVFFLGFKKNPFPYIKNARLMVMCSDFEGLGLVILESISLGTPVISTNCPGGPSEILPKKNLFETDSNEEFETLLKSAAENPENYKSELKDNFNIEYTIERYIDLMK